jgi:hypothetical protein
MDRTDGRGLQPDKTFARRPNPAALFAVWRRMDTSFARRWRSLAAGTPGRRFRDRYHRNRRSRHQHWAGRLVRWVAAAVLLVVGLILTVIPGPAIPLLLLAGALLATDSLWLSKALDRLEVVARKFLRPVARFWLRLPVYGRILLALLTTTISIATSVTVYHLMR